MSCSHEHFVGEHGHLAGRHKRLVRFDCLDGGLLRQEVDEVLKLTVGLKHDKVFLLKGLKHCKKTSLHVHLKELLDQDLVGRLSQDSLFYSDSAEKLGDDLRVHVDRGTLDELLHFLLLGFLRVKPGVL